MLCNIQIKGTTQKEIENKIESNSIMPHSLFSIEHSITGFESNTLVGEVSSLEQSQVVII